MGLGAPGERTLALLPSLDLSTAQEEAAFRAGMGFSLLLALSYLQPQPASGDRGGPQQSDKSVPLAGCSTVLELGVGRADVEQVP